MNVADSPILLNIAQYLSDTLQMELLKTGRIASEALFNSIEAVIEQTMSGVSITAGALYYAKWVNSGRKPGAKGVPLDAIIEWLRIKRRDMNGARERSDAFAVQHSIREKGIKPAPFIDRSINKFEKSKWLESAVDKFMSQYVDEQLQTMYKELAA